MNYLFIIVILVVILFLVDKYIITTKNYGIQSSYESPKTESIGFLKPEHKLLKILKNISSGSKIRLRGKCQKFVY